MAITKRRYGRPTDWEELIAWVNVHMANGETLLEALEFSATHFRCADCQRVDLLERMTWRSHDGWVHSDRDNCALHILGENAAA